MKNKKNKIIIIAVAAAFVIAAVVLAIVGYNAGWFSGEEELTVSAVYDEKGEYVVRDEYYNKDGELKYKVVKGYTDENRDTLSQESYLDPQDKLMKTIHYSVDGKITGVDEFNEAGKASVHHEYLDGQATGIYYEYDYTDSGLPLGSVKYDADGNVVRIVKREYTDDDKITLYLETDGDNKVLSKTVYEYNAQGNESKATFYDADGVTGYVEYEYDSQGRRTKMSEYINGTLNNYRTYTYDENGIAKEEYHEAA